MMVLYDACALSLNLVFDGMNAGAYDGTASEVSAMKGACLQITTVDIINDIRTAQEQGCTLVVDDVGELAVPDIHQTGCADSGGTQLCGLVGAGILHCNDDFCVITLSRNTLPAALPDVHFWCVCVCARACARVFGVWTARLRS